MVFILNLLLTTYDLRLIMKRYICGIFGFPISHSASPAMHHAAFKHLGMEGIYLALEILPHHLRKAVEAIRALDLTGVNVTVPYKEKVLPWLDELSPEAEIIGAVNTIKNQDGKLVGFNTDGQGFEQALKESWGRSLNGARLVLVGAGGAARAVAVQAGLSGVRRLVIMNRNQTRLKNLIRHLKAHFPKMELVGYPWGYEGTRAEICSCDCLVNATSLGMDRDDPMPVPLGGLDSKTYVYDLIYNPIRTRWVREALGRGGRASGGLGMLLYQGALSFRIWTGRKPPLEVMRKALVQYLLASSSPRRSGKVKS